VSSNAIRSDGRRRDGKSHPLDAYSRYSSCLVGCYTCKDCKKKCDSSYTFDEISGSQSCNECIRFGIHCFMTQQELANDPPQVMAWQQERKKACEVGKEKGKRGVGFATYHC
jgi:hypothetical protein